MFTRSPTAMASAPPEPPSPVMVTTMGTGQARHLAQISRDGFGLAALFRVDSRIRAGRVNEGEDRPAKLRGELHDAQRLAVALGLGLSEI